MPTVSRSIFGYINDTPIDLYTITNENKLTCKITNYGCAITSIMAPNKNNLSDEVVIGFDSLCPYYNPHPYVGAIVGEENYPGNLSCQVIFTFYEYNQIDLDYKCTTDKSTLVNLTHHDYFNLNSGGLQSILDHQLMINSDTYTAVDSEICPTGKIHTVTDTQFDFRKYRSFRDKIVEKVGSIKIDNGYDNNFIINKDNNDFAASLRDPVSRRQLNIYSNKPCLQLFTPVQLDASVVGTKNANTLFPAVCLESQGYPDSINQDNFPSYILNPGEIYAYRTSYRFSIY